MVTLLLVYGDTQEGVFLGLITVLNIIIGTAQEVHAWFTLERLQLLAAPRVIRVNKDGSEDTILAEDVEKGDQIRLKIGDQIPCDGHIMSSHGFEVSEALITGESDALLRTPGDALFAGGIVMSGSGIMKADEIFANSRIAQMTKSIKEYTINFSPIQDALNKIIKYTSYALLLIITFVAVRGIMVNESTINIVQNIGALTSLLLPQGLAVITTLVFAVGALNLYRRNVLLREVNAMEKIGRIKNLCMDKTGTLTDNDFIVEAIHVAPSVSKSTAESSVMAYINGLNDSSQTISAIRTFLEGSVFSGDVVDTLSFSSTRQFGGVCIRSGSTESTILVGAPDILLPHLSNDADKEWLRKIVEPETKIGKRVLFFARSQSNTLPVDLSKVQLSAVTLFVLKNSLREGVKEAVDFFQKREVVIRIISGDNLDTVRAVAASAGVLNVDASVTGGELESWSSNDFATKTKSYTIFARIKPEQKERIIEALKFDGFTAMIGDGANDALAIKKADLGIGMFDGALAIRQISAIVLVKNSFSDLPNGIKLADRIIEGIEMCSSTFFNQVLVGFFFFVFLSILGYAFPFTPLNITFINYFTVGLPGFLIFYWVAKPNHVLQSLPDQKSFLKKVIPFPFFSAIPQSVIAIFAFFSSLEHINRYGPTSLVVIAFITVGFVFFLFIPRVYTGLLTGIQKIQFVFLAVVEIILVTLLVKVPFLATFYNLKIPQLRLLLELVPLVLIYTFIQYMLTKVFITRQHKLSVSDK